MIFRLPRLVGYVIVPWRVIKSRAKILTTQKYPGRQCNVMMTLHEENAKLKRTVWGCQYKKRSARAKVPVSDIIWHNLTTVLRISRGTMSYQVLSGWSGLSCPSRCIILNYVTSSRQNTIVMKLVACLKIHQFVLFVIECVFSQHFFLISTNISIATLTSGFDAKIPAMPKPASSTCALKAQTNGRVAECHIPTHSRIVYWKKQAQRAIVRKSVWAGWWSWV